MGGAANLIVLILILLLIMALDNMTLKALGWVFARRDGLFALVGAASTTLLATGFYRWRQREQSHHAASPRVANAAGTGQLLLGSLVLSVVAIQEEVLYRGYVTLNLVQLSPILILVITTAIFVLIHFLTNRVDTYQIISWTISGLVLAVAYLVSGSIWVPIILHLATDLTNVLVFHITEEGSIATSIPVLSAKDRSVFRLLNGIVVMVLLATIYHPIVFANALDLPIHLS